MRAVRNFINSLSSILFDENINFNIQTRAFKSSRFGIPIYAGAALTPEISHLVLRAKENNDLNARRFLAKLIVDAIFLIDQSEINLILIPSRREADRKRGIKHINELVIEVNKLRSVRVYEILEHSKRVVDQSQLSSLQRFKNMAGAFQIKSKIRNPLPTNAFLLDDLVTTGATISAAAKALQVRNIQLLGVIAACATMVFTE